MFISDDFPDPEGPIMAVSFPDSNLPEMHFKMVLNPATVGKVRSNE